MSIDRFDEYEYGGPAYNAPPPPSERDGLRVGDSVVVVGYQGQRWPGVIECFTHLTCDLVLRWTGASPSLADRNTICRKHVREIRAAEGTEDA